MKILSIILLIFVISSIDAALHPMMQKLKASSQFSGKKDTLVIIGNLLLETYEPTLLQEFLVILIMREV